MRKPSRTVALLVLVAFTGSCASTRLEPISAFGANFRPESDEKALWGDARQEEKKLREKARIYNDPLLVDYLQSVVAELEPQGMAANPDISYSVTVVEDPTLNAFAYPHGSLYVHTGLLARMENEDQLATVLGHEMTHVENRHMVRYQRDQRNKQIALTAGAIAGALVLARAQGNAQASGDWGKAAQIGILTDVLLGLGLQLAFLAAVNGYGRSLESEADDGGFRKIYRAGYDPREAQKVFQVLKDDHGDSSKLEAFFFGSHPRLDERIQNAKEFTKTRPGPRPNAERPDESRFAKRLRPVVRDDARLNIELGRLGIAQSELDRVLEATPNDPMAQYLNGRLRLKQAESNKRANADALRLEAKHSFEEAIRLDPSIADAHRELGLMAYRENDYATACRAFKKYLELKPQAEDAQSIRDYRLELERDDRCR